MLTNYKMRFCSILLLGVVISLSSFANISQGGPVCNYDPSVNHSENIRDNIKNNNNNNHEHEEHHEQHDNHEQHNLSGNTVKSKNEREVPNLEYIDSYDSNESYEDIEEYEKSQNIHNIIDVLSRLLPEQDPVRISHKHVAVSKKSKTAKRNDNNGNKIDDNQPKYIKRAANIINNYKKYKSTNDAKYPIVLLHGIASDKTELTPVNNWLRENLPNEVYNIEIGNGKQDSIFKTMDWQLKELCSTIYNIPALQRGFHFIGMSQGGLLARGYVEKCNFYPVINLITWVTPHAGVFGLGNFTVDLKRIYTDFNQNMYSFAGYWKNPFQYTTYLEKARYLPDLNNEISQNEYDFTSNRNNMLKLKNFIMIWSPNDDVLVPPQSGKFGFYKISNYEHSHINYYKDAIELPPIVDLFDSEQYKNDWLGLKTLNSQGRLHILETNCTHTGHKTELCFEQLDDLTFPFLL